MRKSKLAMYEEILAALMNGALTFDNLAYEINLDCIVLKQHLEFLAKNGLVEQRGSGKRSSYAVTEKGTAVLKALSFQSYLEKIANKIRVIDEALEVIRKLERTRTKNKTEN